MKIDELTILWKKLRMTLKIIQKLIPRKHKNTKEKNGST